MIVQKSINMKKKTIISLLDTNIFFLGLDFILIKGLVYTTPSVIEEIKVEKYEVKNRNVISRIEAALENKKLIIKSPSGNYINQVINNSKKTGDFKALSKTDIDLIALALELITDSSLEVTLYTNDYSMENLCVELEIPFSAVGKNGIDSKIIWEVYCPFCLDIFEAEFFNTRCEKCGQRLKRRKKSE